MESNLSDSWRDRECDHDIVVERSVIIALAEMAVIVVGVDCSKTSETFDNGRTQWTEHHPVHGEDANACRMQKQVDGFAFVDIALVRELNGIDAK